MCDKQCTSIPCVLRVMMVDEYALQVFFFFCVRRVHCKLRSRLVRPHSHHCRLNFRRRHRRRHNRVRRYLNRALKHNMYSQNPIAQTTATPYQTTATHTIPPAHRRTIHAFLPKNRRNAKPPAQSHQYHQSSQRHYPGSAHDKSTFGLIRLGLAVC